MLIDNLETLERVRRQSRALVTKRALAAGTVSAVPGAIVGAAADVGLLLEMLPKINRAFGLDPEQVDELDEQGRQQVFALIGTVGNKLIGSLITEKLIVSLLGRVGIRVGVKSAASWVPFVGSGVAAAVGFCMMKTIGNGHVEDCYRIAKQLPQSRDGAAAVA